MRNQTVPNPYLATENLILDVAEMIDKRLKGRLNICCYYGFHMITTKKTISLQTSIYCSFLKLKFYTFPKTIKHAHVCRIYLISSYSTAKLQDYWREHYIINLQIFLEIVDILGIRKTILCNQSGGMMEGIQQGLRKPPNAFEE